MRKQAPYEAQMARIKRWQSKIETVIGDYRNGKMSEDPLFLADMVYAFFTCCDHMKDYIHNDTMIDTDQTPYDYLNGNVYLKICRDISVGTKHLKIKEPKTADGDFQVNLVGKKDKETGEVSFDVNLKSKNVKENFSQLANECIQAWQDFIDSEITGKPKKQIGVTCPNCSNKFEVDYDFIMVDCPKCGQKKILI